MKELIILIIFTTIISATLALNLRQLTYFTIILVFFPVHIQFMGKDAIATGTVCIFFLFGKYLTDSFLKRKFIKETYDYWIYGLILLSAFAFFWPFLAGSSNSAELGPAVRYWFNFLGAMLLFLVIKNARDPAIPLSAHVEKLLSLYIILVFSHVIISLSIKFFPTFGAAFTPFLARDLDTLTIYDKGGIGRIRSFTFGYEAFGEILAFLSPIVIYKVFQEKKFLWYFCLIGFGFGVLFTATRSGIMLFGAGLMLSLMFYFKSRMGRAVAISYFLILLIFSGISFYPPLFEDLTYRFSLTAKAYNSGENFIDIINRGEVFPYAWDVTVSTLSWIGNGFAETKYHFHNLFLTVLFRKGIIGTLLFFGVLLYPAVCLVKLYRSGEARDSAHDSLVLLCLFSLILFFTNEFKYEFIRQSVYQQICWGIFATYYLVSLPMHNKQPSKMNNY